MRREVLDILRVAARKLLIIRAAESAAVATTAAGLSACALEAAWAIAGDHPVAGGLVCLLASAMGGCLLVFRGIGRRMHVERPLAILAAGLCVAIGLAGAALAVAGEHARVPISLIPIALVLVGALLGATAVFARGVSVRDAAIYLDVRCRLGERLSTAAELADRDAEGPLAECVYAQALAAARAHPVGKVPVWRRSRSTAGALVLAALLAGALSFLPAGRDDASAVAERMAESLERLSPAQRKELSAAFRDAALRQGQDARAAAQLAEGARVIEVKDAQKLREIVQALARAGIDVGRIVPAQLRSAMGVTGAKDVGEGPVAAGGGAEMPVATTLGAGAADGNVPPGASYVRVYHPDYARILAAQRSAAGADGGASAGTVSYEDAWSAARRAAAENVARGKVPARYRQIVREFFGLTAEAAEGTEVFRSPRPR